MSNRTQMFYRHLAQTSGEPMALEILSAEGIYLNTHGGGRIADLISGVSVSNTGHNHPEVTDAIEKQLKNHSHLMVYGEYIQSPQVEFASYISSLLPASLNKVFFVNSGAEAIEGAIKLARRYSGRNELISFTNAYHGSTMGALSLMGGEALKSPFRPLLPSVRNIRYNHRGDLQQISYRTAAVIAEVVQAEAGVILPQEHYLEALSERCRKTGTLLILDEVQTAAGRCGKAFAFMNHNIVPDILVLAKAIGGGLPLGAFVSSAEIMDSLSHHPALGHITTFGGHPLSCAAGMASLKICTREGMEQHVLEISEIFANCLKNLKGVKELRRSGLLMAVETGDESKVKQIIRTGLKRGFASDWFLFCDTAFRISPPLTMTPDEANEVCGLLADVIHEIC